MSPFESDSENDSIVKTEIGPKLEEMDINSNINSE